LDSYFDAIVSKYRVMLDAFNFDPQKIGKNEGSYRVVLDAFSYELMKLQSGASRHRAEFGLQPRFVGLVNP
jgi:hypothetical protein